MKYVFLAVAAAAASSAPALAADAPVTLARCDKPIGSIAVVEGDTQGWTKYGLGGPRDLIAAMAAQSGCFTLQANGSGAPADFLLNAIAGDKEEVDKGTSLAKTALTEGLVRSGMAGRMMGGIPFGGQALGMLGGFGGKKKTVAAGLRVISPATGQTIAAGSGEQTKTQVSIGGFGGIGGNPWGDAARAQMTAMGYGDYAASGYASSKDGQMLTGAFVLAFNAVVAQQPALAAVKLASGAAAGGVTAVATKPGYTTAIDTKLYAQPEKGEAVRALRAGMLLTPTGVREGLFVEVSDAYGTRGWVSVEDLEVIETAGRTLRRPLCAFALLYLLSLALCLALGLLHGFRPSPLLLDADEREYYELAGRAMEGGIALSARRTLGFPLVLAAIRLIRDDMLFLQGVVTALYAFSAPLLFLLVRKVGRSDTAGLLAGAALAMWPPAIFFGASLYSETLAAPIFLLSLLALPAGGHSAPARRWAWAALASGMLLGIATHVRPMYLLFVPFMALITWVEAGDPWRGLRRFALVLAGFLLLILPWSFLQSRHFDRPILVTANGGETLAGGLNPKLLNGITSEPTPSGRLTWAGAGKWITTHQTGYLTPAEMALPYERRDAILRERTLAWAADHPGQAALIELRKFSYMWGIYPVAQNGWVQALFGNVPTLALLALALWAMARAPGSRWRLVRFWALPVFVTAVAMISWGSWRFRQPGDAGLIAFCAICVVRHVQLRRGRTIS